MGWVNTEMHRGAAPSGSRAVGVEGNENICHIWRAFWFSNKGICQFMEQSCLQRRRERESINASRCGKDGFLIYKIVALCIFVSSLALWFCLERDIVDAEIIG